MGADSPIRILVVDDELGMRDGCRKLLEAEGYSVETAEDGVSALERFQARPGFGVVLVDLKMPRLGGIELIQRLHALDPHAVLLVITGFATIETAVEATKRGAYATVPKPFTPDELLIPVRNALERRALTLEAERLREDRQRRLLEAVRERSQSRTILNCLADAVLVVNRERQVVLCNEAARQLLPGLAAQPLPVPLERLEPDGLTTLLLDTLGARTLPAVLSRELPIGDAMFMANAGPVADDDGTVLGAAAVLRDITARKALEDEKSRFVSLVAHEVKAPLAAVEGYLNLLLDGDPARWPPSDRAMLDRSLQRIRALRLMVSELLSLRAIESGRLALNRVPLEVRVLVQGLLPAFREKAAAKRIALDAELEGGEPLRVLGDEFALRTVVSDLLDNAIKYTADGGRVSVRADACGGSVRLAVCDDGIGVAPGDVPHLFDEFFRVRSEATAAIPGTGLGLSIVRRLVELHHGTVTVRSVPGKGSRFEVSLPALAGDRREDPGGPGKRGLAAPART